MKHGDCIMGMGECVSNAAWEWRIRKNKAGNLEVDVDLRQRDGETIDANIVQGKKPVRSKQSAPLFIKAKWR